MKQSFKDAARKHLKASTLMFAFAAAGIAYGGAKAVNYYSDSPERAAYMQCVEGQQACSAEQMALVKKHFDASTTTTVWLVIPQMWFLMGLGCRRDEKNKKKLDGVCDARDEYSAQHMQELHRRLELDYKLERAEAKLEQAEAKLAPFLAEEKRKADDAAATDQQLNQMAQDATTLQGQIKVGKKISIKQTPPSQP